jgi:hypothetical protein
MILLVLSNQVLHATPSLHETLKNVRKLLHPRGRLLLQELSPSKFPLPPAGSLYHVLIAYSNEMDQLCDGRLHFFQPLSCRN